MGLRDQRTVLSCLKITEVRRKRYDLHFLGKLTTTLCLFFALALNLHSQVTVSASLTDGTGALYRTAYLHFQLLNCGDNFPAVPSQPGMIVQDSFSVRECGVDLVSSHTHEGLEPSVTRWVICASLTPSPSCYPGTAGTWNPLLAMPMTTPPPAPGFLAVYENPTLGQFISPGGTSLVTRQDSFDIHPDHWFSLSAARGWRDFWILPLGTPRLAIPSLCFTSTGVPASINGAAYGLTCPLQARQGRRVL